MVEQEEAEGGGDSVDKDGSLTFEGAEDVCENIYLLCIK